jgi:hypothetical protein
MTYKIGLAPMVRGEKPMGDDVSVDTYTLDISDIDLTSYYSADSTITIEGLNSDNYWDNTTSQNNIVLTGGGDEMLRVSPDGFYVRGVRVEADEKEAQYVYEAFKKWMTWAIINSEQ